MLGVVTSDDAVVAAAVLVRHEVHIAPVEHAPIEVARKRVQRACIECGPRAGVRKTALRVEPRVSASFNISRGKLRAYTRCLNLREHVGRRGRINADAPRGTP